MMEGDAEITIPSALPRKIVLSVDTSVHEEEGPEDELRAEARDEGDDNDIPAIEIRARSADEREDARDDEVGPIRAILSTESIQKLDKEMANNNNHNNDDIEDDDRSNVSDLTTPEEERQDKSAAAALPSKSVALFDDALLDADEDDFTDDDHTVTSRSVVDESTKNVDKAEALAKEMQRILAENLAGFPTTSTPKDDKGSEDESSTKQTSTTNAVDEPHADIMKSPQNASAFFYSKNKILKLATTDDAIATVEDRPSDSSASGSSQTKSSSSSSIPGATAVPLRRQRPTFRYREMLATKGEPAPSASSAEAALPSTRPRPNLQSVLESIVLPACFLVAATVICQYVFRLKPGGSGSSSRAWTLTGTVLCLGAVAAPIFAFEFLLLGGLLNGTPIPTALKDYPEVKQFLRDVRRIRLRAGWWYPSEVRTLRKDLEATNAEILKKQQESYDDEARSLMSREQQHREKAQLQKAVDDERANWLAEKEKLIADRLAETEQTTKLREQLEQAHEQQTELAASRELVEASVEEERKSWNATRTRLEEALKTAMESMETETKTCIIFAEMEKERDEERAKWDTEREKLKRAIEEAEEKAIRNREKQERNTQELEEIRAAKEVGLEAESRSLKDELKLARDETKTVKDDLECQICQLNDVLDYERDERKTERTELLSKHNDIEKALETANAKRDDCRQQLEQTEMILKKERARFESERKAFQEAAAAADRVADDDLSTPGVPYVGDVVEESSIRNSPSIELSSSNISCASQNSASYYAWVQKIQEAHSQEQRLLLRGLLTQHLQWQTANRHVAQLLASSRAVLEACDLSTENSESANVFGQCLMQYTAASVSAKRYMDELATKTGNENILDIQEMPSFVVEANDEDNSIAMGNIQEESIRSTRSITVTSNSWLRNAPLWEQLWSAFLVSKMNPFQICHIAVNRLYTGSLFGSDDQPSTSSASWGVASIFYRPPQQKPEETTRK